MPVPSVIAVALLVRGRRVLLAHRHPGRRHYPGRWSMPGGHVEAGEGARDAVLRECLEELGAHLIDPVPVPLVVSDPGLEVHAFLVTEWSGDIVNRAPEEHDELRWFAAGEIVDLAHPESLPTIVAAIRAAG